MTRIGWLDCSSGVSGDMLLGALDDLGALEALPAALDSLPELRATVERRPVTRSGLAAVQVVVSAPDAQPHRGLDDVLALLEQAAVPDAVRRDARSVFERLADAEATVHGVARESVQFHEVGAVDSVVDVLGACLGFADLGVDRLHTSTVALGGGVARTGHGELPVPVPAVLELLRRSAIVGTGGPEQVELATPTGVALLAQLATPAVSMPAMSVDRIGTGAGARELPNRPNVLRLVVGAAAPSGTTEQWLQLETNVDDLDPRLWSGVLDALLAAGAADAWLTPMLMKKGRPAHTLSALATAAAAADVRAAMFRESSTLGIRESVVGKHALDRSFVEVDVGGETVRVKVARLDGAVLNATPEWEDVAAAARRLGQPAKTVLAAASAAAQSAVH